jgi:mRNA interferase HigB
LHADAEEPLRRWLPIAERAEWSDFAALRMDFPSADLVGHLIVINIGGNKYRLLLKVNFEDQDVLLRHVLTHAEYDQGKWKRPSSVPRRKAAQHGDSIEEAPKRNGQDKGRRSRK